MTEAAVVAGRAANPVTAAFSAAQPFELDPFQLAGCTALEDGRSVLVAAPTGAGKTIVGEFAVHLAMREPTAKAFYTTPMKALSNQKFRELRDVYGADDVGLLTGDVAINGDARVMVMTTEVLRNMLYADSPTLADLRYVVMDEVHYLADRFRGAVWEEVILQLPTEVRVVSLSATVSNAEEFGDWLGTVRGDTEVIVSESRPVPLEQHLLVGGELLPLFDEGAVGASGTLNPALRSLASLGSASPRKVGRERGRSRSARHRHRTVSRSAPPRADRADVVRLLERRRLLPAIFFVFSRKGCDQAVQQVRRAGVRLTSDRERAQIRQLVLDRTDHLSEEDLAVVEFDRWRSNLERGLAAHHAGLLPVFKEIVEELFQRKLVKVVFATETLALGINMPARTVVLEKLEKFNGEARVPVTAGEYTQLTGRAGRRGIDVEGHAVIAWAPGVDPGQVAALASRRTYPLNSSFRPTYNMAVNLLDGFGRARAREVLESSFAQFQADRAVVALAREVREKERTLAGYAEAMACDRGNFAEYARTRREIVDLEKKGDAKATRLERDRRVARIAQLRRVLRMHSCHDCPDRETHARWGERYWRLRRDVDAGRRRIERRTGTVARVFDRVVEVLLATDYLRIDEAGETELTEAGSTLRRIYGERDLLVAECLRRGLWDRLDATELAAIACCLVYEPRRDDPPPGEQHLPRGRFRAVLADTEAVWLELDDLERDKRLPGSDPLATALAPAVHAWAGGAGLESVLETADMAAGDFVRWAKQCIDLLDQLARVADDPIRSLARRARDGVRRGIVAYETA